MNFQKSFLLAVLSISFTFPLSGSAKQELQNFDKDIACAQEAFDSAQFTKEEKILKRIQASLDKETELTDKNALVFQKLADCFLKQEKYQDAEASYNNSLEVLKKLGLDQAEVLSKLQTLADSYRSINIETIDKNAVDFAKQVGVDSAVAVKKDEKHHIDIKLKNKFQSGLKELIEANLPPDFNKESIANFSLSSPEAPEVKQVRLDKKIQFDLLRLPESSKLKVTNISGISLNVGLWVKVKEFIMSINESNNPVAELTAGALGVDKTVHVDLPKFMYDNMKLVIDKMDPFYVAKQEAEVPTTNASLLSVPASSTNDISVKDSEQRH